MKESLPVPPSEQTPGSVSSTAPDTTNGRSAAYKHSVSRPTPPRKAEIEAELQSRSDAIATRLEAIQSEFSATGDAIKRVVESPLTGVLLALGAGFLVGRLFRGSNSRDDDASDLASLLTKQVEAALATGESPDDAVRRVLEVTGVPVDDEKKSGGTLKWIAGIALRSLVTQGLRGASSLFDASDGPSDTQQTADDIG